MAFRMPQVSLVLFLQIKDERIMTDIITLLLIAYFC